MEQFNEIIELKNAINMFSLRCLADAFDQRLVSEAQHHHQSSDVDPFHAVQNGDDQHAGIT